MADTEFIIIYDTYCGWCYGAAPFFDELVASGAKVRALHRHLFQGPLAYNMKDGKGEQVLKADAKIEALTGQKFSTKYRDNVVLSDTEVLESHYTAQAAALVHDQGIEKEFALRRRLETARYVDGVSASDRSVVVESLVREGICRDEAEKTGTPELIKRTAQTTLQAINLMEKVGTFGVPTVLKIDDGNVTVIDHSKYYQAPQQAAELTT